MPRNSGSSPTRRPKRSLGEKEKDNKDNKETKDKENQKKKRKAEQPVDKSIKPASKSVIDELICPICSFPLDDPTTSPCGHNFCRSCIQKARRSSFNCPVCREVHVNWTPQTNLALRTIIEFQKVECPYEGCTIVVSLGESEGHKDSCSFRPIKCPNKGCAESYLHSEQAKHHQVCLFIPCESVSRGCTFRNSFEQVMKHQGECMFEKNKELLDFISNDTKRLVETALEPVKKKLEEMEARVDALVHHMNPPISFFGGGGGGENNSDDEEPSEETDPFSLVLRTLGGPMGARRLTRRNGLF